MVLHLLRLCAGEVPAGQCLKMSRPAQYDLRFPDSRAQTLEEKLQCRISVETGSLAALLLHSAQPFPWFASPSWHLC